MVSHLTTLEGGWGRLDERPWERSLYHATEIQPIRKQKSSCIFDCIKSNVTIMRRGYVQNEFMV